MVEAAGVEPAAKMSKYKRGQVLFLTGSGPILCICVASDQAINCNKKTVEKTAPFVILKLCI